MKKDKFEKDTRVKKKVLSGKEVLVTFFILTALAAGQAMILVSFTGQMIELPPEFIFSMIGYWAIVAATFSIVSHAQIRRKYDIPMRRLSKAAKEVAEGDFSVYVEPIHTSNVADYMDVMFEDFNRMVEHLGSIETLQSNFIANASHEIRTPLTVIQNYAEVLQKEDITDDTRKEYTQTIISATKNLGALVSNILKLNYLESSQMILDINTFDLCGQLSECLLAFEEELDNKQLVLQVDMEDRCIITADPNLLEIVWNHLISNALKFTETGGEVTLREYSDKETVTVIVSDTGSGMSKETQKHIFEKFYQGDTSHYRQGNGLGLALARQALKLLDGNLTVKSELGQGTSFFVTMKKN